MQIMWNVLRENEQVPNVQKTLSNQMVRVLTLYHIFDCDMTPNTKAESNTHY